MLYLELARRPKGWSQSDLGENPTVGIHRNYISMFERGQALPVPDQAQRIARALSIPVERLLDVVPGVPDVPDVPADEESVIHG